jgi:hypothetical protein
MQPWLPISRLLRFAATDKASNNRMSEPFDLVIYFDPHGINLVQEISVARDPSYGIQKELNM